jgi:integrase
MFYTICMKANSFDNTDTDSRWLKTPVANLVRHVQSGNYYARIRVRGKLIWKSLKTDRISVAKLRLGDFHYQERQRAGALKAVARGKMTFGNAVAAYKQQRKHDPVIKPGTVEYDNYRIEALLESWPELERMDVSKVTESDCKTWSEKNAKQVSSSSHNHTVGILRRIFKIAIEAGARYDNPALAAKRVEEHTEKQIKLPELSQFEKLVIEIKNSGSGFSKPAAELVQFLAYGGFRKSEAANITWADCDFNREKIILRGDPVTGLKRRRAGEFREVPMISEMRKLLEQIREKRAKEPQTEKVMRVFECQKSLDTACKKLGIPRLTHHDLRHLFATRCIESGVDIPTVSRWLGHKDGGSLAMKTYGHLRDEHSTKMAQKVVFANAPATNAVVTVVKNSQNKKPANIKPRNKTVAQAKAGYSYPWWASSEAIEVFWGQANEPVQIMPMAKYLQSAKAAMGREVFEQELSEPQALLEELAERVGAETIEKLKAKISLPVTMTLAA